MISAGEGFLIRHRGGRYFRSDLIHFGQRVSYAPGTYAAVYELVRNPFYATLIYSTAHWHKHLASPEWACVADQFEVVPGPGCGCCGTRGGTMWGEDGNYRCDKHRERNPCSIEGCRCTTAAGSRLALDQYLCSKHWRPLTLPAERRVYSRIWREGKKRGWTMARNRRLMRVWRWIVAKARSRAAGDIDMDEINKLFGWD